MNTGSRTVFSEASVGGDISWPQALLSCLLKDLQGLLARRWVVLLSAPNWVKQHLILSQGLEREFKTEGLSQDVIKHSFFLVCGPCRAVLLKGQDV